MKIKIVDFTTTEVVRGSFGYDSYLLYSALKSRGEKVTFVEDATPLRIHKDIGEISDLWIIHYWSYPQKLMMDWATKKLNGKKKFIGYKPLIKKFNLPLFEGYDNQVIYDGMKNLPKVLREFRYGLMSDCDEHIEGSNMLKVMPLFLSYGCPNNCAFCPIPVNRKNDIPRRVELSVEDCEKTLNMMDKRGYRNIHFCDEDFFMNTKRAKELVDILIKKKNFKYIALASVSSFYNIVQEVGVDKLLKSGLQVVELGVETNDLALRKKMNKTGSAKQLAEILALKKLKDKIFLLSVSLFPGETLKSVSITGKFLKKYGPTVDKLTSRVKANSSVGGLGQFFQPYTGTSIEPELDKLGKIFEKEFPTRLEPSFVPFSLLREKPKQIRQIQKKEEFWWKDVYNLDVEALKKLKLDGSRTINKIIGEDMDKLKHILLLTRLNKLELK